MKLPVEEEDCELCIKGKFTRTPYKRPELPRSHRNGKLIHTDLCGPITPATINGERYFQTITDDFTHFTEVYLLKTKDEAVGNIENYVHRFEAKFETKIYKLRCDNGKEFVNDKLKEFCQRKGIKMQTTIPYTPQQNGVSERLNRTLLDKARIMIAESEIPKDLWGEAVRAAAYVLNRSPTHALKGEIPAKGWLGCLNLDKVRVFGCKAWTYVLPKSGKLEERAIEAKLIGYCDNGYRLWIPLQGKIIRARDVKFDE